MEKIVSTSIFIGMVVVIGLFFNQAKSYNDQDISKMCGTERWTIKVLIDPDTDKINYADIVKTTIADEIALPQPTLEMQTPRMKCETVVNQVECYIDGYKLETDKDVHIVISDDNGNTMIAEIPNPDCKEVKGSSQYEKIKNVRDWFEQTFSPKAKYHKNTDKAKYTFTGITFMDKIHGQTGVADNGVEIHPVLDIVPN
jgi:hypothetical protein